VVDFDTSSPFPLFMATVGTEFQLGSQTKRLYYLPTGEEWKSKQRIKSKSQLIECLEAMFVSEDEEMMKSIYIFAGNESPTTSPVKEERDKVDISQLEISGKPETSGSDSSNISGKTSRSTCQKRFRETLLRRDGSKCLICPETTTLEAAHVIDVESKLSKAELEKLQLFDLYDCSNGIILCRNCHWKYDNWQLGITKDGRTETKIEGTWHISNFISIFKSPEHKTSRLYPSELVLDWKYQKFLEKRERSLISSAIDMISPQAKRK